jgi:Transglutaminase-like superfamily
MRPAALALVVEVLAIYVVTCVRLKRKHIKLADEVPRTNPVCVQSLPAHQKAAVAMRLRDAVVELLARLPTDPSCLVRSMVLIRLLVRHGINSRLVVGVCSEGRTIAAHAWVEHDGVAILDRGGERFVRLLEIDTSRA